MASQVATKTTLRRSKTSLCSLHSADSSIPETAQASGETVMGLRPSKKSSLHLQDLTFPLLSILNPTLQRQVLSLSSNNFSVDSLNTNSNEAIISGSSSSLIQWTVLLALVSQVPNLLDEIRLILDLHYHSFPLLIVLGSFQSLWRQKVKKRSTEDQDSSYSKLNDHSFSSAELYHAESFTTAIRHDPGSSDGCNGPQ